MSSSSDDSLQKELDKEVEAGSDKKVSGVTHVDLIASDNPEYVQRRAEALAKPGAVVMHETLR